MTSGAASPPLDRPYEGPLGDAYALFMDFPWTQRLDDWLLGMNVSAYYEQITSLLSTLAPGPSLEIPAGGAPFLKRAPVYRDGGPWLFADLSWTMLRRVRRKCEALRLDEATQIRADARDMPLRDGMLSNIVSLFGLHCFHDKSSVLAEMDRCLARSGRAVGSTLISDGPPLSRLYMKLNQRDGTFASDNSLRELSEHAQRHSMQMSVLSRSGAAVIFEVQRGA